MENPSISSKSETGQFELIPSSEVIMAQVGVCRPGRKEWYWTKLSGFGKYLRTLPLEIRNSLGYVIASQKRKAAIGSGSLQGSNVYIKLLLTATNKSATKEFSTVDDLLEHLDGEPKIASILGYERRDRKLPLLK
ncbi:hypothetical protein [uncultured Imperialibacter sp.]|uniref:hypothetical protein n=1 Tax=uncultured Imperialibacter sp. TaxID=1672639 RepID=UPI0030D78799|tara:strand:- start:83618 stop:84022 length:405 start_codon:yes stop_codon:yes gene_type:complete